MKKYKEKYKFKYYWNCKHCYGMCKFNLKLIYFSTSYVYPGKKGNYKETDPLFQ